MIRVKNNGSTLVQTGGDQFNPIKSEVFEAIIKPNYLGKGRADFHVSFKGNTKGVNSESKEYAWYKFPEFECGPFEADVNDENLTSLCEAQAIAILGNAWEVIS